MKHGISAAIMASLALVLPASAHHSYAMFDTDKDVALSGTVVEWQWTNPHILIVLSAPDSTGKLVSWTLEGASPAVLRERGWSRSIARPGDKLVVHMRPLRDGSLGGQVDSIVVADGKSYGMFIKP